MPATRLSTGSHDPPGRGSGQDLRGAGDATAKAAGSRSGAMSAGLARNWWAVGLRGVAAVLFGLAILALPSPTIASLVLLFAAYVAADGVFAILAGARAADQIERWWTLIVEGVTNLTVAGAVLVWLALAVVPLVHLAAGWAVVTGALLLAAARRLSGPHGRWMLGFAGVASAAWGALAAAAGPSSLDPPRLTELWLVGYALLFGAALLVLALRLKRRHSESA
jgi:uncharacterized membrane protein HdeD (DUF308 family)